MENRTHFGEQTAELVAHERAYHAFGLLVRWSMLLIGDVILWLTLWFASPAGFWGATFVGVIAFLLGHHFLIRREEKQPLAH